MLPIFFMFIFFGLQYNCNFTLLEIHVLLFKNSHLLQYIALILNMLIKQFFNRVIDEQYCIVHLQKYACVVLLILDTNDLIMCDSVYFSMI